MWSSGGSLSVVYCSVSDSSLYVDVCEACQTSWTDTVAIVGGVVAVVIGVSQLPDVEEALWKLLH